MQPNYSTLETDVAENAAAWVRHVREEYGDAAGDEALAELASDPWLALQWFIEDHTLPAYDA